MPISYAGVDLLLDDPDGVIQAFIDRWHTLDDVRPCAETISRRGNFANHTKGQKNGRGLPIPNYPPPPPVRLNTLYWPTGAARWGTYFALADREMMETAYAIYQGNASGAGSASYTAPLLVLNDGSETISIEMHMLTPRPVTVRGSDANARQLFILPLVDDRYFWQFQGANLDADGEAAELSIATLVPNRTIEESGVPEAFNSLDQIELNRHNENSAVLVDAIAHGTGRRFVRRLNGENHVLSWSSSLATLADTNLISYQQIAGGVASISLLNSDVTPAPVPEKVRVMFRFWRDGMILDQDFDHREAAKDPIAPYEFAVEVDATDVFSGSPPQGIMGGVFKIVKSTAFAIIGYGTDDDERANPTNLEDLEEIAEQIAMDFYDELNTSYDITLAGLKSWTMTSYDDFLEFRMDSASGAVTRVVSHRPNFGEEVNLAQVTVDGDSMYVFGEQIIVLVSNLSRYDGATYLGYAPDTLVYEPTPNTPGHEKTLTSTGLTVRVFSCWGNDDQGEVSGFGVAEKVNDIWLVTQMDPWATPQEPEAP